MRREWIDVTVVGSAYEEQLEAFSEERRHRPLELSGERSEHDHGWVDGPAPQ